MIHKTKKEKGKKHKRKHKRKKKTQKKQQIFRIKLRNDKFRMFGPHSKPISAVPTWFKADFRRFNPFRLFWSPIDMTRFGQYGLILAEWARFDVNRSRVNANWAKSTRIREKIIIKKNKKKLRHGTDSRAATSDAAPRDELRRTLVRHPPSRNCAS